MHNPRLDRLTDYPFQRLNALLDGLTPGAEPLALHVGEPQHAVPALVPDVLAADTAAWGKYPPPAGSPAFRAAVAAWMGRRYALPEGMIDADRMILPVSGSREGLFMIGQVLVPEVKQGATPVAVLPNPFYQPYLASAVMNGAEPVLLDAGPETGFLPDVESLPAEVLDRAAFVVVCSPANPQGAVVPADRWRRLVKLARAHDFVLIADECYSEIYSGNPPPGVLEACRDLGGALDHVVVFNSLSKRSNVPGMRTGFVAGDPDVIARFLRLRSYGCAGMPGPIMTVSTALWADEAHVVENRRLYAEKMQDAAAVLGGRFGFAPPAGGFFLWLDVGDGETATRRLWTEAGVRVLPGSYLAQPAADGSNVGARYIRVALVQDRLRTRAALERIAATL